jgi:hypothetical protein
MGLFSSAWSDIKGWDKNFRRNFRDMANPIAYKKEHGWKGFLTGLSIVGGEQDEARRQAKQAEEDANAAAEQAAADQKRSLEYQAQGAQQQVELTLQTQRAKEYAATLTADAAPDAPPEVVLGTTVAGGAQRRKTQRAAFFKQSNNIRI